MKLKRLTLAASRRLRVRKKLRLSSRPRLTVFRSGKHLYAQIIDDRSGKTLAAASDLNLKAGKDKLTKSDKAALIGANLAAAATKAKVTAVTFDRGSYKFHGRIKSLAQAARSKGLSF